MNTHTMTKREWAKAALAELGEYIASAPRVAGYTRGYDADALLQGLMSSASFADVVADPTAEDGVVDYCMVCEGEPHGANCPVGMLEALVRIGMDTATPLPPSLGLRSVPQ